MRILDRYITKNFIISFFFCISLLMILGIIGDVLGFLDDIFKNDIPLINILSFYFYLAPFAFVNMLPFACLISAVYVFNTLSKNHEVTAVITSGVCLDRLIRPIVFVVLVLCLLTFIVNDRFVPSAMRKANIIRHEKLETSKNKANREIKDIAVYGEGDRIIYAKGFNPETNSLENVIIHKQNKDHHIVERISARTVKWNDEGYWTGEDVILFEIDPEGVFTKEPLVFKYTEIDIKEKPKDFINNQWDPKYMSYRQLKKYIEVFRFGESDALRRLLVDLHYKLSFPFTALITILIGIPFSIATGRTSALVGMAKGITVAIAYLPVMAICLALGKGGILPPLVSAWLSNIVFACLGMYFVYKKS